METKSTLTDLAVQADTDRAADADVVEEALVELADVPRGRRILVAGPTRWADAMVAAGATRVGVIGAEGAGGFEQHDDLFAPTINGASYDTVVMTRDSDGEGDPFPAIARAVAVTGRVVLLRSVVSGSRWSPATRLRSKREAARAADLLRLAGASEVEIVAVAGGHVVKATKD